MVFYSRHQLLVLVGLIALFGTGLAVDRWRRAHPEVVERIEQFDREEVREVSATDATAPRALPSRPSTLRADAGFSGTPAVDLNRATADELKRLPGIGPGLAARIIEARDVKPFASIADLRRVRGLGTATLERLRPLVTVSAP